MARNLAITGFGTLTIPVKAIKGRDETKSPVSFNQVHVHADGKPTGACKQKNYCEVCAAAAEAELEKLAGKPPMEIVNAYRRMTEVEKSAMSKGYKPAKNDPFTIVTDIDLLSVPARASAGIRIQRLEPASAIDARWIEDIQYLMPGDGGSVPFNLFATVLAKSNLVATGLCVLVSREQPCAIVARDGFVTMFVLTYPNQLRPVPETGFYRETTDPRLLAVGMKLAEQLTTVNAPKLGEHKDDYGQAVQDIVALKVMGQPLPPPQTNPEATAESDLLSQLEASVKVTATA